MSLQTGQQDTRLSRAPERPARERWRPETVLQESSRQWSYVTTGVQARGEPGEQGLRQRRLQHRRASRQRY